MKMCLTVRAMLILYCHSLNREVVNYEARIQLVSYPHTMDTEINAETCYHVCDTKRFKIGDWKFPLI